MRDMIATTSPVFRNSRLVPRAVATALCVLSSVALAQEPPHNYRPPDGYVPNAATAIRIAVAVWEPIYGHDTIARETPYVAKLDKDVWVVTGSLPKNRDGGVAVIEIAKQDSRILRVSHGK